MEFTGARYADKPAVEVHTWIDARASRVWQVVSNVELTHAMSPELQAVEWLDGATEPSVDARFVGRAFHVGDRLDRRGGELGLLLCDEPPFDGVHAEENHAMSFRGLIRWR